MDAAIDTTVNHAVRGERTMLKISGSEWGWSLAFMLSLTMCGLNFPLGYVVLLVILLNRVVRDRYDFLIQITVIFGGYALVGNDTFGVPLGDVALALSVSGLIVCRRTPLMSRVLLASAVYLLCMLVIASTSEELMSIQLRSMRVRWGILYFIVPVLVFAGKDFDMKEMMRRIFPYVVIVSAYYVIDGFVLNGWVMLPFGMQGDRSLHSTYLHLVCTPLSMVFPRIFAQGLYLMGLVVFPLAYYYKIPLWQWVFVLLAFIASRTMTVVAALVVAYVLFRGHGRKLLLYLLISVVSLPAIYFIDKGTGGFIRVQSTIDQFIALSNGNLGEADLADFASGRGAQVLPKMEALYDQDREWLGFGFLHPELTKKAKFMIDNDLYLDVTEGEEVATAVEVGPVQTILDMGYIGLIVQLAFFSGLYLIVRPLRYSGYYLCVLICVFISGLSGYSGLNGTDGLILLGFALGCVLLAGKQQEKDDQEQGSHIISVNHVGA